MPIDNPGCLKHFCNASRAIFGKIHNAAVLDVILIITQPLYITTVVIKPAGGRTNITKLTPTRGISATGKVNAPNQGSFRIVSY